MQKEQKNAFSQQLLVLRTCLIFVLCFSKAKAAYEVRGEVRDRCLLGSYRFKGKLIGSFKTFMEYVNEIRKNELYEHKTRDCHAHCKARGCGVSFSVDGLWKIRLILIYQGKTCRFF